MDFAFLHGGGQGSWIWDETIAAMEAQAPGAHRVLALDAPGCGAKRGQDTDAVTFSDIVAELNADIEAAGMHDVILVGHSQAGTVLPALAMLRPDLFRRLIYASCIAPIAGETAHAATYRLHAGRGTSLDGVFGNTLIPMREQYRLMFCNDMSPAEQAAFLDKLEAKDAWPPSAYLHSEWKYDHLNAARSTYILFQKDAILTPGGQQEFANRLRCGRIARIDAGHQAQNTRPHAFAEILRTEAAA